MVRVAVVAKIIANMDSLTMASGCELVMLVQGSHDLLKSVVVFQSERTSRLRYDI